MSPTISDGQKVYYYTSKNYKNDDIVILTLREEPTIKYIIKRYIASAGDLITIKISPEDNCYHLYKINKNTNLEEVENIEDYRVDEQYINSYMDHNCSCKIRKFC